MSAGDSAQSMFQGISEQRETKRQQMRRRIPTEHRLTNGGRFYALRSNQR